MKANIVVDVVRIRWRDCEIIPKYSLSMRRKWNFRYEKRSEKKRFESFNWIDHHHLHNRKRGEKKIEVLRLKHFNWMIHVWWWRRKRWRDDDHSDSRWMIRKRTGIFSSKKKERIFSSLCLYLSLCEDHRSKWWYIECDERIDIERRKSERLIAITEKCRLFLESIQVYQADVTLDPIKSLLSSVSRILVRIVGEKTHRFVKQTKHQTATSLIWNKKIKEMSFENVFGTQLLAYFTLWPKTNMCYGGETWGSEMREENWRKNQHEKGFKNVTSENIICFWLTWR